MSRRLAADFLRPRKQNLQMSPGTSVVGDVPRRGPGGWRRCGDAGPHVEPEGSSEASDCPCRDSGEKESVQINVFIDSYYPKLRGDFSEDCENSVNSPSSYSEVFSKILICDRLGIGGSPESDSTMTFRKVKNAIEDARRKAEGDHLAVFGDRKFKSPHRATLQQSSRSRLTLDSKTYTLFSRASNISGKEAKTAGTVSTVDWFAQLYMRIETLEDLLQEALATSQPQNEKAGSREKSRTRKTKFLVPEMSTGTRTPECGTPPAPEGAGEKENLENLDTDNELQRIKERVRALEEKLKQAKADAAPTAHTRPTQTHNRPRQHPQ